MKKLVAALAAGALSFSIFAFDVFSYIPVNEKVTGYTVTEYSIETKFGEYFKTVSGKVDHVLDVSGKDVESVKYSARGVADNKMQTTYDSIGNILNQVCYDSKNGEDVLLWKSEHLYKKGTKTESNDYDAEGNLKGKTKYKYDGNNLVDETSYSGNGTLVTKVVYKYDDEGRLIVEAHYLANGSLDEEIIFAYKEDGKIDSITEADPIDGTLQRVFRYSDKGLITEVTTYALYETENKVTERLTLKYDADGNVSKVSNYAVAEKFGTTVNELNYMAEYSYSYDKGNDK